MNLIKFAFRIYSIATGDKLRLYRFSTKITMFGGQVH